MIRYAQHTVITIPLWSLPNVFGYVFFRSYSLLQVRMDDSRQYFSLPRYWPSQIWQYPNYGSLLFCPSSLSVQLDVFWFHIVRYPSLLQHYTLYFDLYLFHLSTPIQYNCITANFIFSCIFITVLASKIIGVSSVKRIKVVP